MNAPRQRVVVIGAGIIGSLVAWRLALSGRAAVTVVDPARAWGNASYRSVSWVNATGKRPRAYYDLSRLSMERYPDLAARLGGERWWRRTGNLEWAETPSAAERLERKISQLTDWDYPIERLPAEAVTSRLEPDLHLTAGVDEVVLYPEEGHVHVDILLGRLTRALQAADAVRRRDTVSALTLRGTRVTGVRLGSGEHLPADTVITCAGSATNALLTPVGVRLPLVEGDSGGRLSPGGESGYAVDFGLLVHVAAAGVDLRRVVHAPGVTVIPAGHGGLRLHAAWANTMATPSDSTRENFSVAEEIRERATPWLPGLAWAPIESAVTVPRPLPADDNPIADWVPGLDGLYAAVTHSGVTLAPILSELICRDVLDRPPAAGEFWRLSRFDRRELCVT